jgi:phosphoribosyl 1,2-cyclic phosphodiesterase
MVVEPVAKPHDAAEPVGFLVHHDGETLGIFTDLGSVDATVGEAIGRCTSLVMEANYDPRMLADGPYPAHLKSRIASRFGHLSNADAANAVAHHAGPRLRTLVLAHLSEQNNAGHLARLAFLQSMGPPRAGLERWVSGQDRPTRIFGAAATSEA